MVRAYTVDCMVVNDGDLGAGTTGELSDTTRVREYFDALDTLRVTSLTVLECPERSSGNPRHFWESSADLAFSTLAKNLRTIRIYHEKKPHQEHVPARISRRYPKQNRNLSHQLNTASGVRKRQDKTKTNPEYAQQLIAPTLASTPTGQNFREHPMNDPQIQQVIEEMARHYQAESVPLLEQSYQYRTSPTVKNPRNGMPRTAVASRPAQTPNPTPGPDRKSPSYEDFWRNRPEPSDPGYRPESQQKPTWYRLYGTTTPENQVSPPFATIDELAQHMIDREYGTPERIQAFVDKNYAMSLAPSTA